MTQFCMLRGCQSNVLKTIIFSVPKDCLFSVNNADPDKMLPYVSFHQGHHCLPKYPLLVFIKIMVKQISKWKN